MIIMGEDREGVSQFNERAQRAFSPAEIKAAQDFQREQLARAGFSSVFGTPRRGKPQTFRFNFLPESERGPRGAKGPSLDGLASQLTLEESLLYAELVTGRRRGVDDPRDEDVAGFDETLFYGNFVL
jgi:hypothetical protein